MDETVFGFGLCCTAVPVVASVVIAWMARGRAEEAITRADMAMLRLEVLQRQLSTLKATLPVSIAGEAREAVPPSHPGETADSRLESAEGSGAPPVLAPPAIAPPAIASPAIAPPAIAAPDIPQAVIRPPRPPVPPAPAPAPFEWEKWIGVRGAAVLGGIVFAMAGLYLFKYSIAQGWISPAIRVIGAVLTGLAALVGSQKLRARYEVTGQALGGGGIVVLYAATWASKALYELIPLPLAFVLMMMITAVAVVFAVKQDNRIAAYLGLVGGFATPLMLSTGQNAPGPLFTYVFFLDVALLGIAYLKKWKSIAALALGGTLLMEFGWVFTKMEPQQVWIAFVVMAIFAALFGVFSNRFTDDESAPTPASRLLQGFALLTPTVVLVYFGASTSLAVPLAPTAGFLAVLLIGAAFIHRKAKDGEEALLSIAVAAVLMVLGLAASNRAPTELTSVTFLLVNLGLAALGVLNVEFPQSDAHRTAALATARWLLTGIMGVLLLAAVRSVHDESHLTFSIGFAVITLLFVAMGRKDTASAWQILVGLAPAAAFAIDALNLATRSTFVDSSVNADPVLTLGPSLVLGVALLGATFFARVERVVMAFVVATLSITILSVTELPAQPLQVLWALGLITALGVAASIRGTLRGAAFTMVLLFGLRLVEPLRSGEGELMPWTQLFLVSLGAALVLHVLLFFAGQKFHEKPWGPVALATALPASFPGMLLFWRQAFGRDIQGALAVGLAVVALGSALVAQRSARSLGSRGVMWLLAAACTLTAIAVPLQLENQWVTISWALMAVAYLGLWKRFDSRGLKWLALTLLMVVSVRLILNPWVLEYHQRSGVIFFNWLTYTYLIPAACLIAATWLLTPDEVSRARGWETGFYAGKIPWGASSSAIGGALVVFAWVTLSVFDFFSQSSMVTLTFDRLPARDVALSLSWVLYAVALLAIGMWRKSRALRWMSLVFLLASIGKVFLYDLGQLKDLFRVASLMGLAISLIVISLAYQRFVFRRVDQEPK
jgi:uncharacterized membrane protein